MRRPTLLLAVALLGLAGAPVPQGPASASCTGPYLEEVEDLVLERGGAATIRGRSFVDGCQDSVGCSTGPGCDSCEYDDPAPRPMDDVRLRLVQHHRTWTLAIADAGSAEEDRLGWVTWTFDVPRGVQPGRARLVPDDASPVPVRVR